MKISKVLVVDDEPLIRHFVEETLCRKKIEVFTAENGKIAIDLLEQNSFDLIITDLKMPVKTGIDVLKKAKELSPRTIVILMTAYASVETAVEAMRLGAFTYIIKPFSPEVLETLVEKASEHHSLVSENHLLRQEVSSQAKRRIDQFIAESSKMKQILCDIQKVAKSNATVFITGESGTGKEVVAHALHHFSDRSERPFIKVNCAAIPSSLIESEFFGHEKGSFTGALNRRAGRFELANQGTLLLDEVTEVPLGIQSKLLRVIQEQEFERVGGASPIQVDVRLIATSNRNMKEAIEEKIFREDLFYRLNVIPIHLPPLRERKEDILPLAEYFLQRFCSENKKRVKQFSEQAKAALQEYSWPGNIRELGNLIERVVVMDQNDLIQEDDLLLEKRSSIPLSATPLSLEEVEKRHILETLAACKNNRTLAAERLGISVKTLRSKISI